MSDLIKQVEQEIAWLTEAHEDTLVAAIDCIIEEVPELLRQLVDEVKRLELEVSKWEKEARLQYRLFNDFQDEVREKLEEASTKNIRYKQEYVKMIEQSQRYKAALEMIAWQNGETWSQEVAREALKET